MEFFLRRKKLLYAGCAFFLGMFLFTLLSKGIYAAGLAQVSTVSSQKREIGHVVEAEGLVIQGREEAVSTLSGLKVKSVYVDPGESVSGNTLLFDLDQEYLHDKMAQQELEVLKLQKSIAQIEENKANEEAKKQLAENRSLEDYALADTEQDRKIEQAGEEVADVQQKLQENAAKQPEVTPEEERQEKKQAYQNWTEREKELKSKQLALSTELKKAETAEENAKQALEQYIAEHGQGDGTNPPADDTGSPDHGSEESESGGNIPDHKTDEPGRGTNDSDPGSDGSKNGGENNGGGVSGNDAAGINSQEAVQEPLSSPEPEQPPEPALANSENSSSDGEAAGVAEDTHKKELEQALAAATAQRQAIQEELNAVEEELARHELNAKKEPDYTAEDSEYESWKSGQEALEDSLEDAQQAQENSVWGKLDAMLEEKRKVEDSTLPENVDKQLEIDRAELALRQEILERYHAIEKQGGGIYSESEGVVTDIKVSAGELTTEGACVVIADLTDAFRFITTITKEEKKYVDIGDTVSLKLGKSGSEMETAVDYMAENPSNPELYELMIRLPEGVGQIGQSGKITASVKSDSYPITVPIEALHSENKADFIYTLRKQEGILGEELAVTRTSVRVLDKNDKYAAIEGGAIEEETEIVVFSTKELADGMVVRYQAE